MHCRRDLFAAISLTLLCLGAGLWSGCTVEFDPGGEDVGGAFPCTSNDDCIEGFRCEGEFCVEDIPGAQNVGTCIDEDGDGYGTGDNRTGCEDGKHERDCDDDNADIHPGATERCNGVDDDCDGETEQVEYQCGAEDGCGDAPEGLDFDFRCENGTCTLRPWNRGPATGACQNVYITCDPATGTFTYEDPGGSGDVYNVDEGPVLECN